MNFTLEKLSEARNAGIPDDVIWRTAIKADERFAQAKEKNIPLESAFRAFQKSQAAKPAEPEPKRRAGGGIVGGAADVGVQFMKGLGTGTRMISDVFGANNPVSQAIAGYEDYMDSLLSAESKQDSQEISRILKDAEGKGILPQIMAGLEAFTVAPAEMTATTMGMMLPNLAGGVYAKAAQLTKAGALGLQMGIGAAQGIGSVKGQIYTAVQEELRQQGLPEDQIEPIATKAQAYNGKNLDQLLIAGGLGAIAASTGAEKIMTRLITGAGKEATEGLIKSTIKGGLAEAPIEALQGGQEKVAENVALQRIGVDVPTMQGVIPAATMEATAGLLIGGGFGAVESVVSPEKRETDDIETKSEQTSRELTAENTPMAQAMVQELARRENAVKNLQDAYDAIEPTSQEAQRLKLELGDAQRKLGAFKETAAKAGLSVTITPVEQQQIELARGLAAKPEPETREQIAERLKKQEEEKDAAAAREQKIDRMVQEDAILDEILGIDPESKESFELSRSDKEQRLTPDQRVEFLNKITELSATRLAGVSQAAAPTVTEAPAITPAPVAETAAVAPAPEVAPATAMTEDARTRKALEEQPPASLETVLQQAEASRKFREQEEPAGIAIGNRVKTKTTPQSFVVEEVLPQSEREVELGEQYYRIRNERTGEMQTVEANDIKPIKISTATKKMAPVRVEEKATPVPEADRYTFEEAGIRAIKFFNGKAPDGLVIVNDSTDPDYEMKAGYDPETGDIILNRAYIKKGESIEDILTHELGHYIFSDPKFQADFKNFLESMPDDTRAEIEAIINQSYNKDTNQTQIEERQVMAFTALVKANKDTLSKWETIKNTIKRWINKVFGTKIKLSDEGAMAVFNVGFKRFKSGERIIRAMEEGTLRTAPEGMTQMDRDYLAAVERGDMETAQRMVDEAAKKAGYTVDGWHRTDADFTIFKPSPDSQMIYFGLDEKGVDAFLGRYAGRKVKAYLRSAKPLNTKDTPIPYREADRNRPLANTDYDSVFVSDETGVSIAVKDPSQIKSADPVTYDDAGNVIPLSQRFRPTSPDIRRMAAEPRKPAAEEKPTMERYDKKSQVAGVPGIGAAIDTPKGINAKTEKIIQERVFNADIVNDNQTKRAWNLIQSVEENNPEAGKNAQAINELTRETMQDVEADEVVKQTIGAVKLRNELYKYAMKLTAEGDNRMLQYLLNNRLSLGSGAIIEGDDGRRLQAMASLKNWIVRSSEAEQTGFFTIAAQQFFGTKTPTEDQIKQIKNIFNKVREVKIDQEKELMTELEDVGKAAGVDLPNIVQKELDTAPGLDPMVVAIQNLLRMGGTFTYRPTKNKIGEAVKRTITQGITNYRKKMVTKAATGLETGFWKTLASTEDKPGPLGELDAAQNRALGNIVKQSLVAMGLKGTPPDTKMSIYEQVASILGEKPLSKDKIEMADEKIRGGIEAKRQAELENASENQKEAIDLKYDEMLIAWDDAMSRSLDMPVSDTMLRRLILNELKDTDSSIQEIAKLMDEEPAIGTSRQDRLVNGIIEKIIGSDRYVTWITAQGKPEADYTKLKNYLSDLLENMIRARQEKNRAAKNMAKVKRDASGDPDKQAQAQIDKLAKIQADPTIFGEKKIDPVRNAVRDALSLKLNIGFTPEQTADIKRNWKGAYVADPNKKGIPTSFMLEMQRLGVSEAAADTLAEIVWKQIEVNAMNRQMDSITKAVEAGPIGGMVQAILDTPLANQQDPEWRKQVIVDYLKNAGVKPSQAENIAKLFDLSLRKRFAKAQEEAAIKAAKSIKGGLTTNSRRALEKFLKAIRAQVLDPGKDVAKAFGEQMGWKGFTKEQIVRLNELDAIVNDNERTQAEVVTAIEQIQQIIDKVSAPPRIRDILSSFYVGNALMRFTTFAIQAFDPLIYSGFNTAIRSIRNATSPTEFIQAWSDYGTALSNFFRDSTYSYKNDTNRSGRMIDYIENEDRNIKRLGNEAIRKLKEGNIRGALKDGLFGYTSWTFRVLRALDDGAYSLLQSSALPQYVEAALKNAKIPREKRRGVMRQILQARQLDIDQMIQKGIPRNDAIVYANERMQSAITRELSDLNIDSQEVINSAINDALSRIGKTRFTDNVITGKTEEIKDLGGISTPFVRFYEIASKFVNQTDSEMLKIFYRIVFGFPLIPARMFNIAAGYTPFTLYRHALQAWKGRYQLTYGTALQRRQRLAEQLAGTMIMLPLFLLRSNSLEDDDEKKKGFAIYITGQGPSRQKDKTLHAKWNDAHKPFSLEFKIGGETKFAIDAKSSGPFGVMIYLLGALDDWGINRKLDGLKTTKDDWRDAQDKASIINSLYELSGYTILTTARRGPTTALMQGLVDWRRFPDDPISAIGAEVSFSALPAVPILGTGVAKNLSDFFSQPIDNRTKEGAILSNIPIVGPIAGQPALNAYGQRLGELRFSEKLKKSFGVPFTLVVSDNEENNKLTSITLKQGNGPSQLRREDIENALQDAISDEEWRTAAEAYGKRNRERVLGQYNTLFNMKPDKFAKKMTDFSAEAEKAAIKAVKDKRAQNP